MHKYNPDLKARLSGYVNPQGQIPSHLLMNLLCVNYNSMKK